MVAVTIIAVSVSAIFLAMLMTAPAASTATVIVLVVPAPTAAAAFIITTAAVTAVLSPVSASVIVVTTVVVAAATTAAATTLATRPMTALLFAVLAFDFTCRVSAAAAGIAFIITATITGLRTTTAIAAGESTVRRAGARTRKPAML